MNVPLHSITSATLLNPPSVAETLQYIKHVYGDRTDKAGVPCWKHPYEVMLGLPSWVSDDARRAALLHDTPEDTRKSPTPVTRRELETLNHSTRTCDIVDRLTFDNRPGTFLERVRELIASNDLEAIQVKLSDVRVNRSKRRNAMHSVKWQESRGEKYDEPLLLLEEAVARLTPRAMRFGR